MLKLKRRYISGIVLILLLLFILPAFSFLTSPIVNSFKSPFFIVDFFREEFVALAKFHINHQENKRLKSNQGMLMQNIIALKEMEAENSRLKSLLDFKNREKANFIAARVISRDSSNLASSIILDKGSSSGIKEGLSVVSPLGLVGRVVDIRSSICKVVLINDPNLYVPSVIQRSRCQGLVSGRLKGYFVMQYIPSGEDIKPLDIVVTSGIAAEDVSSYFPKDVPVGVVTEILPDMHGAMLIAYVKPFVDLNSLEEVLVVK